MFLSVKSKLIFSALALSSSFFVGRYSVKKTAVTTTQIQYKDRIVYVKQEQKQQEFHKEKNKLAHIVIVEHRSKQGEITRTKTIDYNSQEKSSRKKDEVSLARIQENTQEDVKSISNINPRSCTYSFLAGRSFTDQKLKYMALVGFPLFFGLKGDVGVQTDKTVYAGLSFNY